jgi:hypothetical protein
MLFNGCDRQKRGRDQNAESGQSDLVAMAFCLSLCPDYCKKTGAINHKKATHQVRRLYWISRGVLNYLLLYKLIILSIRAC